MNKMAMIAGVLLALLCLSGCGWDEAIARAEKATATAQVIAEKAEASVAVATKAVTAAQNALEEAQKLAKASGSEQAQKAVDAAGKALAIAQSILPEVKNTAADARQALDAAQSSVSAAKAAKDAGGSSLEIIIAIAGTLVPAIGLVGKLVSDIGKLRTAVSLTAAHADAMETASDDQDVARAKVATNAAQIAAGVHTIIQTIRAKA
jgi:chromosome segregation ATPase